jgi:cation diffusion facilitator family transporter
MAAEGKGAVVAALVGNLLVAATKCIAAFVTGSSAMLSEAVHSLVDTGNEVLLLHGMRRSRKLPDASHPIGYGRELYFWSFIVALLLFALGAGVSIYQGIVHIREPEPISRPTVNYVVLGLSLLFEGGSWIVAARGFAASKGDRGWWAAIRASKNPPQFMVLLEDSAAIVGIGIALAGTWAAVRFDEPRFDGVASIAIGLLLAVVSIVLARESKGLLIGERGDAALDRAVRQVAGDTAGVIGVNNVITVQLAPDQVLVMISIEFDDAMTTSAIEQAVEGLEQRLRAARAEVHLLFVKPQTAEVFARARYRFMGPKRTTVKAAPEAARS